MMDFMNVTTANSSESHNVDRKGGVNIPGLVSVIIFYILIFAAGLYASWKAKKNAHGETQTSEDLMLAGRSLGMIVGFFTMTATWVGGAFINGTAELVFSPGFGLAWTLAPVCYSLSLILGGLVFAKKMREAGYITMLDPFNDRYGQIMAGLLYIPALLGETFWSGAVLSALGSSLAVILNLDHTLSVLVSAGIAVFYTIIGGLYSVAYTDVVQLVCIFIGLWLGVGFSLNHPAVSSLGSTMTSGETGGWVGHFPQGKELGLWLDNVFLLSLGGIPWQVYFQRVLSAQSAERARVLSFLACLGCFFMAIPPVLTGAIARSTDWNATQYAAEGRELPIPQEDHKLILPMVLRYLCPLPVALLGLGAVSAAVMSSADSSILSAATMFAHNIYAPLRGACCCSKAADKEIIWMMRLGVILVGAGATTMAITVESIYSLWCLCSDLCYVVLFPQLLCVVYFRRANTYGALAGFLVGFALRLTGGEPIIGLPALIKYPWYDEITETQYFPFKTLSMLISLACIVVTSLAVRCIYARIVPPEELDYILMRRADLQGKRASTTDNQHAVDSVDYKVDNKISTM